MSGFEVAGAVGVAFQLANVATKAVKLFSEMSTGFKDTDGTAARIHNELSSFKQSAKAARNNLSDLKIDNLDLEQALLQYEDTVTQLRYKMQIIQSKTKLVGRTKMWMELMSSDSEVTMLRRQLRQHTRDLTQNFTLVMLKGLTGDVREIKTVTGDHYELSRTMQRDQERAHRENALSHRASEERLDEMNKRLDLLQASPDVKYRRQTSEKKYRAFEAPKDVRANLQTPAMSPFSLHDYGVQTPEKKHRAFEATTDVRASSQTRVISPIIRLHDTDTLDDLPFDPLPPGHPPWSHTVHPGCGTPWIKDEPDRRIYMEDSD
jgi:uncharacterized phage infection (PIP) family protein YhgE